MTGFVVVAVGMTVFALFWVLIPLLRRRAASEVVEVRASNLAILRDQIGELERDLASGVISVEQHAKAHAELGRRAIEEDDAQVAQVGADGASSKLTAIVVGLLIPVCAAALYAWIGEPAGLRPAAETTEKQVTTQQIDDMVAGLAAKLEKNPDDARGWAMLARSYYVMQRMPEAVKAYARATEKASDDASLYADYADAVAMDQGRKIEGKALELVDKALKLDPNQPKALAMAGTAAFYRKDFPLALKFWEKLLPMLPPESEMAKSLVSGIAEARELGGIKGPAVVAGSALKPAPLAEAKPSGSAAGGSVSGRVTLSPALKGKVSPDDTVFILARAVNGPRIPLAVLRKRVADLPVDFVLDDALAMRPELKISGFGEVIVSARVSKSGNAISQSGDFQGASGAVKVGAEGVAIQIDRAIP